MSVKTITREDGSRLSYGPSVTEDGGSEGFDWTRYSADDAIEAQDWAADDTAMSVVVAQFEGLPELTAMDTAILRKMHHGPDLATSTSSRGWQPGERDLAAVQSMMDRGILEKRPGFDSLQLTVAGSEAMTAETERQERERNARMSL